MLSNNIMSTTVDSILIPYSSVYILPFSSQHIQNTIFYSYEDFFYTSKEIKFIEYLKSIEYSIILTTDNNIFHTLYGISESNDEHFIKSISEHDYTAIIHNCMGQSRYKLFFKLVVGKSNLCKIKMLFL